MIAYLYSSVIARAYLPDEDGHTEARELFQNPDIGRITGAWTRIEVSGALVRAARASQIDPGDLLAGLDAGLSPEGPVTVVSAPRNEVEHVALRLVRTHALRAMDAWHLAVASILLPQLAEPRENLGFASRDTAQRVVAATLGLQPV